MDHSSQKQVAKHIVSLRIFHPTIKVVMDKTFAMIGDVKTQSLLPTLIGVDVDYNGHHESVPVIRGFFKQLRKVHQKHFVRFVTDTLWAMESDNSDTFYTHDDSKDDWCTIV